MSFLFAFTPLVLLAPRCSDAADATFRERVAPFLVQNCVQCHGGEKTKADLSLAVYTDEARALKDRDVWLDVRDQLAAGDMPPKKRPRPAQAEIDAVIAWIDRSFGQEEPHAARDPGRVTLHRLNRIEYENTIRDLLGVDFHATREFPSDDVGYGFDDIGDVLSMPDILMEKYLAAAHRIVTAAIVLEDPDHPALTKIDVKDLGGAKNSLMRGGERVLSGAGEVAAQVQFPRDGEYLLRAHAFGEQAGPEPARMELRIDGKRVQSFAVEAAAAAPADYEVRARVRGGARRVAVAFTNDYYRPEDPDPKNRDRNLVVQKLEIVGPLDPPQICAFQRQNLPPNARCDVREIVRTLAGRAWRRPATDEELERLVQLAHTLATTSSEKTRLEREVQIALEALLASPNFLFRVEIDPAPDDPAAVHDLGAYELASRLSYFLWSSMPDDELFALAQSGALLESKTQDAQIARMLDDTRSSALVEGFAEQWLEVRNLERVAPDALRFPGFDDELRAAMRAETAMFFEAILHENRSVWELVDADFTFLNERLARHYGIPGIHGERMRRVHLADKSRGGVLTQASVLTVTSNPTRTSPVKRGKWILEELLGKPPPPPPPGVGTLDESAAASHAASMRERLEAHRTDASCAACHARMDPLGFGLENYDAVGAWRERDGDLAVDASGALPDGRAFKGPAELKALLEEDGGFVRCLTKKLATYALGRGLTKSDEPAIDALVRSLPNEKPTLRDVVQGIVRLHQFKKRRGEKAEGT